MTFPVLTVQEWGIVYGAILGTIGAVLSIWNLYHQRSASKTYGKVELNEYQITKPSTPANGKVVRTGIRVRLTNIGAVPLRTKAYWLYVKPIWPLSFFLRFFKPATTMQPLDKDHMPDPPGPPGPKQELVPGQVWDENLPDSFFNLAPPESKHRNRVVVAVEDTYGRIHLSKHLKTGSREELY